MEDDVLEPVGPDRFIPVPEGTGLIVQFGEWVLRIACAQACAWRRDLLPGMSVSVNLSGRQLAQRSLHEMIGAILEQSGLEPCALELELTESMLMDRTEENVETLAHLKRLGLKLAIDDFGTGYSSLGYLRRFPIAALKIDRNFVAELGDEISAAIVRAASAMSLWPGHGTPATVQRGARNNTGFPRSPRPLPESWQQKPLHFDLCAC